MTTVLVLAALLTTDGGAGLQDDEGHGWTILTDPAQKLGGGMASKSTHHVLRDGKQVAAFEGSSMHQTNPTMHLSTEWQFRLDAKGRFEAESTTSVSKNHVQQESTITLYRWDGKALVPSGPR